MNNSADSLVSRFKIRQSLSGAYEIWYAPRCASTKEYPYSFRTEEEARAALVLLEYFVQNGGIVTYEGSPEEKGRITGFKEGEPSGEAFTPVELVGALASGGRCPLDVASHILGMDREALCRHALEQDDTLTTVDIGSFIRQRMEESLIPTYEEENRMDGLGKTSDAYRYIRMHESVGIFELIEQVIDDPDRKERLRWYLMGMDLKTISKRSGMTPGRLRNQLLEDERTLRAYLTSLVHEREYVAALTAKLLATRRELEELKAAVLTVSVKGKDRRHLWPMDLDWAERIIRLMAMPVNEWPIPRKVIGALRMAGVSDFISLLEMNRDSFLRMPKVGLKGQREVEDFFDEYNLRGLNDPSVLEDLRYLIQNKWKEIAKNQQVKVEQDESGHVVGLDTFEITD